MLMEYRLETVLGVGGFGITYLAQDTLLEKDVAIKEYFPSTSVSRGTDKSVTLTGPDMAEEYETGLDRFLTNRLGIEVMVGNPFTSLDPGNVEVDEAQAPVYITAMGLAMRGLDEA